MTKLKQNIHNKQKNLKAYLSVSNIENRPNCRTPINLPCNSLITLKQFEIMFPSALTYLIDYVFYKIVF